MVTYTFTLSHSPLTLKPLVSYPLPSPYVSLPLIHLVCDRVCILQFYLLVSHNTDIPICVFPLLSH